MKKFLQKYGLSEEQINAVLAAYQKEHPEAKELPEYIGKVRFDEVNTKLKDSEKKVSDLTKQLEEANKGSQAAIDAAVKAKEDELTKTFKTEKDALVKEHSTEIAIMNAHGKNIKAIRALIDPEKPIDEELKRIQESDSYLFGSGDDIPGGTGKSGGSGDGKADKELQAMREAVGVI
jgi:cytochrome oxidase Cu insertion factor (SCO1/SenC/PrrC family)